MYLLSNIKNLNFRLKGLLAHLPFPISIWRLPHSGRSPRRLRYRVMPQNILTTVTSINTSISTIISTSGYQSSVLFLGYLDSYLIRENLTANL